MFKYVTISYWNMLSANETLQVYFALSSLGQWNRVVGAFDMKAFYWDMLRMFDGSLPIWQANVLKWWQE